MARNFNGSNQNLQNNNGVNNINVAAFTMAMVFNPNVVNVNQTIWMTASQISGGNSAAEIAVTSGGVLFFRYRWTGGNVNWTGPTLSAGTDYGIIVNYDRSSTANDPRMWVNGVEETLTESSVPSGSPKTGVDSVIVGENVGGGGDQNGKTSELAFWSRILADGECEFQSKKNSPLFVLRGLEAYWDLIRGLNEHIQGANLTNNGSTVAVHPGVTYPEAPRSIFVPAAVAGADVRRHIIPAYTRLSV